MIGDLQAGRYDRWRFDGNIKVHCLPLIETRATGQVELPFVQQGGRFGTPLQQRMPVPTSDSVGTIQVGLFDSSLACLRLLGLLWLDPLAQLNRGLALLHVPRGGRRLDARLLHCLLRFVFQCNECLRLLHCCFFLSID